MLVNLRVDKEYKLNCSNFKNNFKVDELTIAGENETNSFNFIKYLKIKNLKIMFPHGEKFTNNNNILPENIDNLQLNLINTQAKSFVLPKNIKEVCINQKNNTLRYLNEKLYLIMNTKQMNLIHKFTIYVQL